MKPRLTELNSIPLQLKLGRFDVEILRWGFIAPEPWRNYLHLHSYFEVCYAFAGCGSFRIANEVHSVRAGDVFIARPDDVHEILAENSDPLGIVFWSYTLTPGKHSTGSRDIDRLLEAFLMTRQRVAEQPIMAVTLELLTEELSQRQAGFLEVVEGLVCKLLLDTARAVVSVPAVQLTDLRSQSDAAVALMMRYIQDNFDRPMRVSDVVAQVQMSERHARRLFSEQAGCSIKAYLTDVRLKVARQLLLGSGMHIADVAYAVGFADVRHFSTLFRQFVGVSPTTFRQQGGTKHLD